MGYPANIVYKESTGDERTYKLNRRVFRIGRLEENDLTFNNRYVSRLHAEIIFDGSSYLLYDLDSTFGTFVNGERIKQHVLEEGDCIRLGRKRSEEFIFRAHDNEDDPAQADPARGSTLKRERVIQPEDARFINSKMLPDTADLASETVEWLRSIYEFTSDLLTVQSSKEVCDKLAAFLYRTLRAERCAVMLHDSGRDSLEAIATYPPDKEVTPSRSITHRVFEQNVALLSVDAHKDPRFAAGDSIQRQSIRSVICAPIGSKTRLWGVCYVDNLTRARAFDDEELEFATAVARQSGIVLEDLHLVEEQGQLIESFMRALAASIDARDDATAGHSARVGAYSAGIARTMGLARDECRSTYYAGLLHDYGKIGIRDHLLLKAEKLTGEEYEQIKEHAQHTFRILSKIRFPEAMANIPLVASCHHERWDGSGYPRGLAGEEIPLGSRIVAVADAYDALVEERVYSKAVPAADAVAEIVSRAKTHFDPDVVEAFVKYFNQDLRPHHDRRAKGDHPVSGQES